MASALRTKFALEDTQPSIISANRKRNAKFIIYDEGAKLDETRRNIPSRLSVLQDGQSFKLFAPSESDSKSTRIVRPIVIGDVEQYHSVPNKLTRVPVGDPRAVSRWRQQPENAIVTRSYWSSYDGARCNRSVMQRRCRPLQPFTRPLQPDGFSFDRPGRPTGKENDIFPRGSKKSPSVIEISVFKEQRGSGRTTRQLVIRHSKDAIAPAQDRLSKGSEDLNIRGVRKLERHTHGRLDHGRDYTDRAAPLNRQESPELLKVDEHRLWREAWLCSQETELTDTINKLVAAHFKDPHDPDLPDLGRSLTALYETPSMLQVERRLEASLRFGALTPMNTENEDLEVADVAVHDRFLQAWTQMYDPSMLDKAIHVIVRDTDIDRIFTSQQERSKRLSDECILPSQNSRSGEKEEGHHTRSRTWHHTMLKSLMIILLLDQAAVSGALRRPVFRKTSPIKTSCKALDKINVLLGSRCTDIDRKLARLGYQLRYTQEPVSEYDYYLKNLAVDLRDGVRLAHLVDTIHSVPETSKACRQDRLSQRLKIPAATRPTKLYNVQIVIDALKESWGTDFLHYVPATSLVDGHRETTLTLVWMLACCLGSRSAPVDCEEIRTEIACLRRKLGRPSASSVPSEPDTEAQVVKNQLVRTWATLAAYQIEPSVNRHGAPSVDGTLIERAVDMYWHLDSTRYCSDHPKLSTTDKLKSLDFGATFANFFGHAATKIHVAKPHLQIAILALLCSQLLSATKMFRDKRERLKQFAESCKAVVDARRRATGAAIVLQRAWRASQGRPDAGAEASHVDIWLL